MPFVPWISHGIYSQMFLCVFVGGFGGEEEFPPHKKSRITWGQIIANSA